MTQANVIYYVTATRDHPYLGAEIVGDELTSAVLDHDIATRITAWATAGGHTTLRGDYLLPADSPHVPADLPDGVLAIPLTVSASDLERIRATVDHDPDNPAMQVAYGAIEVLSDPQAGADTRARMIRVLHRHCGWDRARLVREVTSRLTIAGVLPWNAAGDFDQDAGAQLVDEALVNGSPEEVADDVAALAEVGVGIGTLDRYRSLRALVEWRRAAEASSAERRRAAVVAAWQAGARNKRLIARLLGVARGTVYADLTAAGITAADDED